MPFLSVIIPAYNEETNIRLGALDKVSRYMERQAYSWEAIIVNDGSSDHTKTLLDEFVKVNKGFRVLHNVHLGKAGTVATGVKAAKGDIVLFTDLDQATPIRELEKILPWFQRGFDVVIGSRSSNREGAPVLRIMMARGFMLLRSMLLGLRGIVDTQCGFKAFKREAAHDIFQSLKLYGTSKEVMGSMVTAGFDIEVIFLAKKRGYKIKEVPVEWHYVETRRVNPIKDSWQGLMDIFRIRLNAFKGYYS
jgi:glycosyltransferase involved in cell wall biosynthesis